MTTTHLPGRPRRWSTILLAVLLFLAGGATGAALAVVFVVHRVAHMIQQPQDVPPRLTAYLRRHLGLTDAQASQLRAILDHREAGLIQIRHDVDPRVQAEIAQLRSEVAAVMTDAQRPKWYEMFDHARDRWLPPAATTQPERP
jgi:hypothetical protein